MSHYLCLKLEGILTIPGKFVGILIIICNKKFWMSSWCLVRTENLRSWLSSCPHHCLTWVTIQNALLWYTCQLTQESVLFLLYPMVCIPIRVFHHQHSWIFPFSSTSTSIYSNLGINCPLIVHWQPWQGSPTIVFQYTMFFDLKLSMIKLSVIAVANYGISRTHGTSTPSKIILTTGLDLLHSQFSLFLSMPDRQGQG